MLGHLFGWWIIHKRLWSPEIQWLLPCFVFVQYVCSVVDFTRGVRLVHIHLAFKAFFFLHPCCSSLEGMDSWANWDNWRWVEDHGSHGYANGDASSRGKSDWVCCECATTAGRHPVREAQMDSTLNSPSGGASSNKPCTCSLIEERVGKIETEIVKVTQLLQDQEQYLKRLVDLLRDQFPARTCFPILRAQHPKLLPSSPTSSPAAQDSVLDPFGIRTLLPVHSRCPGVHGNMRVAKEHYDCDVVLSNSIKIESQQQLCDWYNHLGGTLLLHENELLDGLWRMVADEHLSQYEIHWAKASAHKGFLIVHKPCRCVTFARWAKSEEVAVWTMHDVSKHGSHPHNQAIQAVKILEGFVGIQATGNQA